MALTTLRTWDTALSADCVAFCPTSADADLFLCGTYQLTDGVRCATLFRFSFFFFVFSLAAIFLMPRLFLPSLTPVYLV